MKSLLLFALLFGTIASCKVRESVSDDKFVTAIQTGYTFFVGEETNLMGKVHYPQWVIYYTAKYCPHTEEKTLQANRKSKYEEAITQALKTWLQPLAKLTDKKLIGSNHDDFVYKDYDGELAFPDEGTSMPTMFKFASVPAIEKEQSSHVLEISFGGKGSYLKGRIANPCLGEDNSHKILLHELGHAFSLLDTYEANDWATSGKQPSSIMSASYEHSEEHDLVLTKDDVYGIQWLYRYYQKGNLKKSVTPVELDDCPFPDYEYLETRRGGVCRPRHFLMYSLKQAHLAEKHRRSSEAASSIIAQATVKGGADIGGVLDLDINHQDKVGNASTHYLVLFGAWAQWSNLITSHWLSSLKSALHPEIISCSPNTTTICIELNIQNNSGDTALHYAARTGYVEAIKALLARKDLNAKIKNKQGETACDIAKKSLHNLQAAELADIKVDPTQTAQKIQEIRSARTKIINLLTTHKACF